MVNIHGKYSMRVTAPDSDGGDWRWRTASGGDDGDQDRSRSATADRTQRPLTQHDVIAKRDPPPPLRNFPHLRHPRLPGTGTSSPRHHLL